MTTFICWNAVVPKLAMLGVLLIISAKFNFAVFCNQLGSSSNSRKMIHQQLACFKLWYCLHWEFCFLPMLYLGFYFFFLQAEGIAHIEGPRWKCREVEESGYRYNTAIIHCLRRERFFIFNLVDNHPKPVVVTVVIQQFGWCLFV